MFFSCCTCTFFFSQSRNVSEQSYAKKKKKYCSQPTEYVLLQLILRTAEFIQVLISHHLKKKSHTPSTKVKVKPPTIRFTPFSIKSQWDLITVFVSCCVCLPVMRNHSWHSLDQGNQNMKIAGCNPCNTVLCLVTLLLINRKLPISEMISVTDEFFFTF